MAVDIIARGMAAGKADLVGGKVPADQLPSYVDEVVEVESYSELPDPGDKSKIYLTLDNHKTYRWTGTVYIDTHSEGGGDKVEKSQINGNIKVDDNELVVYVLPEAYKQYLDKMTYVKPSITQFDLLNDKNAKVSGNYESGTVINIVKFRHYEKNIENIAGVLKFGSTEVTPSETSVIIPLSEAITVDSTISFALTGTDTQGNAVNKTVSFKFDRYAYYVVDPTSEAPASGKKLTPISEFSSNGADFSYKAGDYLYLYTTLADRQIETYVLGQWATTSFENLGSIDFTQENGVEHQYYVYRVGPFIANGTAKYRV